LPYDLANTPSFFTLSHLIKLLSETSPGRAVTEVLEEVRRLLYIVHELLESESASSELVKYIDISGTFRFVVTPFQLTFIQGTGWRN